MKNNLLCLVFFFSFLCGSQFLSAQCIHGVGTFNLNSNSHGPSQPAILTGQTFTANATGNITSISIGVGVATVAATHDLRIAGSTNPPTSFIGGGVYQTFTTSGGAETVVINLTSPFPVIAGSVYAYDITYGGDWDFQYSNPPGGGDYAGGQYYVNAFGTFIAADDIDHDFEVCISPTSGGANVPTLSEWGLIILALLLLTLGTVYLMQPKNSFEQEG